MDHGPILLVGGQGVIGCWIVRLLLEEGAPFILLDARPDNVVLSQVIDPEAIPSIRRVFGDLRSPPAIARAARGNGVAAIIHLLGWDEPPRPGAREAASSADP